MNRIYVNEISLYGQYETLDDFLENNMEIAKCLRWSDRNRAIITVLKKSDLYNSNITKEYTFNDLRINRTLIKGSNNDKKVRLKMLLDKLQMSPPFWDVESDKQNVECYLDGLDIGGSSIAEAAATRERIVLSFVSKYSDKKLNVMHDNTNVWVYSFTSWKYFVQSLYDFDIIDDDTYLKLYFKESRLNFSKMESKYGLAQFEKKEKEECINMFKRFAEHEGWKDILNDNSLVYKEYSPSSKNDDWTNTTDYHDKKIDKFRLGNPKRCHGYRDGDVFYVLRLERDHSISDKG